MDKILYDLDGTKLCPIVSIELSLEFSDEIDLCVCLQWPVNKCIPYSFGVYFYRRMSEIGLSLNILEAKRIIYIIWLSGY